MVASWCARHMVRNDDDGGAAAPLRNTSTMPDAVAKRSAGDFWRQRSTTAATAAGMWRQREAIGSASLSSTRAARPRGVDAWNGWAPLAYSYMRTPYAKTSERASAGCPFNCSGDM